MADPSGAGAVMGRVVHAVGPVPLVALGGGIVVGLYLLHRSRSATAEPAPAADEAAGLADSTLSPAWQGNQGNPSYLVVGNGAAGGSSTAASNSGSPEPADNLAWQRRAEIDLIALGYDPITVESALSQYLQGQALTQQQGAIVNLALAKYGPPPNPPPAPIVQAPPPSTGGNTGGGGDTGTVTAPAPAPAAPAPAPAPTPVEYYVPGGPINGPILVPANPALPVRSNLVPRPATRQL
jgi:hypothetical protein